MWGALILGTAAIFVSWSARKIAHFLGPHVAYHVAGGAVLLIAALTMSTLIYGAWFSLSARGRSVVWERRWGSLTLGAIGLLFSALPAAAVLQKAITLDHLMNVHLVGNALRIDGAISSSLKAEIERLGPFTVTHVALGDNLGGMVSGILAAEPLMEKRKIDTVVIDGKCASSCALLALMFPRRLLSPGGELGYHNLTSISGGDDTGVEADRDRIKARLIARGMKQEVVDQLFTTAELNWYSSADAQKLGLVTGCWSPASSTEVPCSQVSPSALPDAS